MNFLERALDGRNQWWKYLVVTLVSFFGGSQIIGSIPLVAVMIYHKIANGSSIGDVAAALEDIYGTHNVGLILMTIPFIVWLALTIIMVKTQHGRSFSELVNGTKTVRWGRVFAGILVWGLISVVMMAVSILLEGENCVFQFNAAKFIPLVIIALLLIPLQTTAEELFFRGYIMQGIGAGTRSRWWALIIPAVAFGLLHSFNPEVQKYGLLLTMPQYILFGFIFGIIAILDDGIEITMGMHFINNFLMAITLTHSASAMQTDALFRITNYQITGWDTLGFLLAGSIVIYIFYKKYKWNWKILTQKVELQNNR